MSAQKDEKYNEIHRFHNLALSVFQNTYLCLLISCLHYCITSCNKKTGHNKKNPSQQTDLPITLQQKKHSIEM